MSFGGRTPGVVVRVDGGPLIGFGHAMRSATLCEALRAAGADVAVVTIGLPERVGRRLDACGATTHRAESSDDAIETIVAHDPSHGVLFDGYQLGREVERIAALGRRIAIIDDNRELPVEHADVVINQNPHARREMYSDLGDRASLLLGTEYVLLRPDIVSLGRAREPDSTCVLVSLGGADPLHLTAPLVIGLLERPDLDVIVAVGPEHPHRAQLQRLANDDGRLRLDGGDLTDGLARAGTTIIGGGTTMYEVAHLGIPAIAVVFADNQRRGAAGAAAGGFVVTSEPDVASVLEAWDAMAASPDQRTAMSTVGPTVVDGGGADRVARALLDSASSTR